MTEAEEQALAYWKRQAGHFERLATCAIELNGQLLADRDEYLRRWRLAEQKLAAVHEE